MSPPPVFGGLLLFLPFSLAGLFDFLSLLFLIFEEHQVTCPTRLLFLFLVFEEHLQALPPVFRIPHSRCTLLGGCFVDGLSQGISTLLGTVNHLFEVRVIPEESDS